MTPPCSGGRDLGERSPRRASLAIGAQTLVWREGNVLFNDALNTFYLRLYGRERGKCFIQRRTQHILSTVIWEREREMFYSTTHSTHFIYGYMGEREENVLFNDALNTFYLRLYGRERGKCFI